MIKWWDPEQSEKVYHFSDFHIGQEVIVKYDLELNKLYEGYFFIDDMELAKGHHYIIDSKDNDGQCDCYILRSVESGDLIRYGWTAAMLIPAK